MSQLGPFVSVMTMFGDHEKTFFQLLDKRAYFLVQNAITWMHVCKIERPLIMMGTDIDESKIVCKYWVSTVGNGKYFGEVDI